MTVDYQCLPCQTNSCVAGVCSFCGDPFMQIVSAEADQPAPAPDWPDEEIDSASRRTVRKAPAKGSRTRKARA